MIIIVVDPIFARQTLERAEYKVRSLFPRPIPGNVEREYLVVLEDKTERTWTEMEIWRMSNERNG